jgi:histidine phosphotransferase ChpT
MMIAANLARIRMAHAPDAALLNLAETLTTRLCHDMAGLVASLSGTLELLLEGGGTDPEAGGLATECARALAGQLRLYRAAWGGGDLEESPIAVLADGLPNRRRLNLELGRLTATHELAPDGPRMVLCVLLAATAAMPAGGTLTATATPEGGFTFTMAGRNAAWPAAIEEPVTADLMRGPQDARNLALPMARLVAAGLGWRLAVSDDQLSATPPMAD